MEHLASLRAIPGLNVIRPADANEVRVAWKFAVEHRTGPTVLIFSRQNLPTIDRSIYSPAENLTKGAYVLADLGKGKPEIILMASGSEVGLIFTAGNQLAAEGRSVRIISFPSWELFTAQPQDYQESVFPKAIKRRLSVEAAISMSWRRWVGDEGKIIALDHYAQSAPGEILFKEFGFTVENVLNQARELLK